MIGHQEITVAATLIADFVGLRVSGATEARLASGLEARCQARRLEPSRYLSLLAADADERQSLVDVVTVPETSWFREANQISVLVAGLPADRQEPIVIWSAGCASGQEPYSLAIAMAEAGYTGTPHRGDRHLAAGGRPDGHRDVPQPRAPGSERGSS